MGLGKGNALEQNDNQKSGGVQSQQVLVVDDDPSIRTVLEIFLESKGYKVLCADSVAQAQRLIFMNKPDYAILDYHLIDETSEQIADTLRQCKKKVPILLLTSAEHPYKKASLLGADVVLTKPCSLKELSRYL